MKRIKIELKLSCLVILGLALLTSGCRTWDELPELEYNRWVEQVPNTIMIDSTRVRAVDNDNAAISVYFNFNRQAFEAEWDAVASIRFSFKQNTEANNPDSLMTDVIFDEFGLGIAIPQGARTENQYQMRHQIILENGRTSLWSSTFQINTPSF